MPFGLLPFKMNKRILLFAVIALLAYGCKDNNKQPDFTISPEAGANYTTGKAVALKVNYPAGTQVDSVVYLLDSARIGVAKDTAAINLKTDSLALGARIITAKIYQAGKSQELTTNINLLAKPAEELNYTLEKVYPHSTTLYTEGLIYDNNGFYESGGGYGVPVGDSPVDGPSSLVRTDLATGKVVQKQAVDPKVFAEGIVVIGDKIMQLTWKDKIGYVYDKKSLKLLSTFDNNVGVEGWGMTYDGTKIYMDDSTNRIWFLDKNTYKQIGFVDVYDDKGAVNEINELEYIDGMIYANVYHSNTIYIINPKTGAVIQKVDLTNLYPEASRNPGADVLNGIAYDKATKRIFVTGKKWDKLFQVKFEKK